MTRQYVLSGSSLPYVRTCVQDRRYIHAYIHTYSDRTQQVRYRVLHTVPHIYISIFLTAILIGLCSVFFWRFLDRSTTTNSFARSTETTPTMTTHQRCLEEEEDDDCNSMRLPSPLLPEYPPRNRNRLLRPTDSFFGQHTFGGCCWHA